jgi:hypothetical protein
MALGVRSMAGILQSQKQGVHAKDQCPERKFILSPDVRPLAARNLCSLCNLRYLDRAHVTDISLLGKMEGWEVAQQARQIDPEFPVVYMSGAHAADWSVKGVPNSIMLAKPFAPAQLVTAISNLLNSGTPTT